MAEKIFLSIVIPLYNEEESIHSLYEKLKDNLRKIGKSYEIIFIDDGSTDRTFEAIKNIRKKDRNTEVISFRKNFGQTAAIKAGFDNAKGEIIVTMDGDLQNDPGDIEKLLKKVEEGYEVVSGWRHNRKDPILKKIPSKISNWLNNKLSGLDIHDSGCTLKAYKKEATEDLELYGEIHRYIPAILDWRGFKVGEVKVRHHPRKYGKTKYGQWRLVKGFLDLVNLKFWTQYSSRPLHFFGPIGLLQLLLGFFIGLYLSILRLFFGQSLANRPLLFAAILLMLLGVQFITFGFLSEIMIKVYFGSVQGKNYDIVYSDLN
ncbi:MAG: glycosyltransferase family 2 protein [Candidatus Hodarchaeales archaeon]|jgi:glycosyltransferase involved in cell wall biosynthesis